MRNCEKQLSSFVRKTIKSLPQRSRKFVKGKLIFHVFFWFFFVFLVLLSRSRDVCRVLGFSNSHLIRDGDRGEVLWWEVRKPNAQGVKFKKKRAPPPTWLFVLQSIRSLPM